MKQLLLMAAAIIGLSVASTAAMADNHGHDYDDHKGNMMKKVDTDGDGMVSKDEFMARHQGMFEKMDADGDGMLSKDEMKDARSKMKEKMKDMKDKSDY